MDDELTAADWRRGRRLLRDLLPWAKAEMRKLGKGVESGDMSPLGEATTANLTENNLDALLIYPAPLGGWHADVVFKNVPPGFPNSMGTPVGEPLPTRPMAEDRARKSLIGMLRMIEDAKGKGDGRKPVFLFFDGFFELQPLLFERALALAPGGAGGPNGGYESQDFAIHRIEEILATWFPGGFSRKAWSESSTDARSQLMTVLHIAALTGVFAYPPRKDGVPSDEGVRSHEGVSDRRRGEVYH